MSNGWVHAGRALAGALVLVLWGCSPPPEIADKDPYLTLARELAGGVQGTNLEVMVGAFLYEDGEAPSPYSALLHDEMERALGETGRFRVVSRDRLNELQDEERFRASQAMAPGAPVHEFRMRDVQGIVRGRFFRRRLGVEKFGVNYAVEVHAELVMLDGTSARRAKATILKVRIPARIEPASAALPEEGRGGTAVPPSPSEVASPETPVAAPAAASALLPQVPGDFKLELALGGGRKEFTQGETVTCRVMSPVGCHLAVMGHAPDGSKILLFPNAAQADSWVPAGQTVTVPDPAAFVLRVKPPYGKQVIQAIGCTRLSDLAELVRQVAPKGAETLASASSPRVGSKDEGGPAKWGEARVELTTRPAKAGGTASRRARE